MILKKYSGLSLKTNSYNIFYSEVTYAITPGGRELQVVDYFEINCKATGRPLTAMSSNNDFIKKILNSNGLGGCDYTEP